MNRLILIIVLLFTVTLISACPVCASSNPPVPNRVEVSPYIDPTAGGVLIQVLLVGAAGVFGLLKLFWRRIFNGRGRKQDAPASAGDEPDRDAR